MAAGYDLIVIGAGVDGLVAAATCARAGRRVLILERGGQVGGRTVTEEFHPGFMTSPCLYTGGRLRPRVLRDLKLPPAFVDYIGHDPLVFAPLPDGRHLSLWRGTRRSMDEIARFSSRDAAQYPRYLQFMRHAARAMEPMLDMAPPDIHAAETKEIVGVAHLGLNLRLMGRSDLKSLLRLAAMSAADFLGEWFETDVLKAALAAPALQDAGHGPHSPGSAALMLILHMLGFGDTPRGGMGAVTGSLAKTAVSAGATVRLETPVVEILLDREGTAVTGVRLADGEVIRADCVLAAVDPRTTFQQLLPARSVGPTLARQMATYRARGRCARIDLALANLPAWPCLEGSHFQLHQARETDSRERLRGRIHIGPDLEALETAFEDAGYGRASAAPVLEVVIPSMMDASLAPKGQHVMSILAQSAPYHLRGGSWDGARERFAETVLDALSIYMPGLREAILHQQIMVPPDLERRFGLAGGHLHHGELSVDQIYFLRPRTGTFRYATPFSQLFITGSGTHPGAGVSGAAGANAAREVLAASEGASRRHGAAHVAPAGPLSKGFALLSAGLAMGAAVALLKRPADTTAVEKPRRKGKGSNPEEDLQI